MGRSGPGILDLLSSIGLRAPYTKCASDWQASEDAPVREFYMERIPNLCEMHFTKTNDEILRGTTTRNGAIALFEEYGPAIWSRAKHRPWLFNPGEITKHARYDKKLYFDVPEDNAFLKEKVVDLVIERIFRHHKEHISKTRASSIDGSWRATPAPTSRSTRTSLSASVTNSVCFSSTFRLAGHQDAKSLQEQGVWLGDYDEEKEAVNGPSYDDVQRDYFFQTDAGKRRGYNEPCVFDEATETSEDFLLCAGCQTGALLKIECHEFEWEDEDSETVMTKNIWTYPCKLGDRKVFALIKQMPHTHLNTTTWGFWRVDGGYTSNLLLASRPRQSPPKRSADGVIDVKRKQAKQGPVPQEMEVLRSKDSIDGSNSSESSGPSIVPREWASINHMGFTRQSNSPQAGSSKRFGKLPLRDGGSGADQAATSRPSPTNAVARSISDGENLYESTPRPEQRLREELTNHMSRDSPTIRKESTPAANSQTTEAPPRRFRYFISVSWTAGQNIVMLDDTMDVQTVYSRVQRTLSRKLEGKNVASMSFIIQDEEPIDVEVDDGDAWETVVDMVKEAGLFAVKGTVSRMD